MNEYELWIKLSKSNQKSKQAILADKDEYTITS